MCPLHTATGGPGKARAPAHDPAARTAQRPLEIARARRPPRPRAEATAERASELHIAATQGPPYTGLLPHAPGSRGQNHTATRSTREPPNSSRERPLSHVGEASCGTWRDQGGKRAVQPPDGQLGDTPHQPPQHKNRAGLPRRTCLRGMAWVCRANQARGCKVGVPLPNLVLGEGVGGLMDIWGRVVGPMRAAPPDPGRVRRQREGWMPPPEHAT